MIEWTNKTVSIQPIDLLKYAGASGDFNPIHTVPEAAKKMGHPDVIAHGMYVMGLASQVIEEWSLKGEVKKFKVRFIAPTYPGDLLTIKGSVVDGNENNELMKGEIKIVDSSDEIKLKGSFELINRGGR